MSQITSPSLDEAPTPQATRIEVRRVARGTFVWTAGERESTEPRNSILSCVDDVFAVCSETSVVVVVYRGDAVLEVGRGELEHCREEVEERLQAVLDALADSR